MKKSHSFKLWDFLPNEGDQTVFNLLLVFFIAGKLFFQHLLLVSDALDNDQGVGKENHKGNQRTQHQRHGKEEKKGNGIHGMADNAVQSGIHNCLTFLNFNDSGKECILPKHFCIKNISNQESNGGTIGNSMGKGKPAKPVI